MKNRTGSERPIKKPQYKNECQSIILSVLKARLKTHCKASTHPYMINNKPKRFTNLMQSQLLFINVIYKYKFTCVYIEKLGNTSNYTYQTKKFLSTCVRSSNFTGLWSNCRILSLGSSRLRYQHSRSHLANETLDVTPICRYECIFLDHFYVQLTCSFQHAFILYSILPQQ